MSLKLPEIKIEQTIMFIRWHKMWFTRMTARFFLFFVLNKIKHEMRHKLKIKQNIKWTKLNIINKNTTDSKHNNKHKLL